MPHRTAYINGDQSDIGGSDNGDRFSSKTIVSIVLGVAGALLLLLGTRWLDAIDRQMDGLQRDITGIKSDLRNVAVEQAKTNTKLELVLSDRVSNAGK